MTKTYTFHDKKQRYTVVGVVLEKETPQIAFGVSMRNRRDNFSRKMGRKIALGRAEKNPLFVKDVVGDVKEMFYKEASTLNVKEIITELSERKEEHLTSSYNHFWIDKK